MDVGAMTACGRKGFCRLAPMDVSSSGVERTQNGGLGAVHDPKEVSSDHFLETVATDAFSMSLA